MANVALRGFAPRRLEREDSYSTYTESAEDPYYDDYDYRRDMESDQEVPEHERPDHELPELWEQWMHEQDPEDHEFPGHFAEVPLPVSDHSPRFETHGRDDPMIMQTLSEHAEALREHADVPPRCEICHTPCRLYDYCNFCRRGPVMHHGRCCHSNPGRWY
jgi:hypothetical protein